MNIYLFFLIISVIFFFTNMHAFPVYNIINSYFFLKNSLPEFGVFAYQTVSILNCDCITCKEVNNN